MTEQGTTARLIRNVTIHLEHVKGETFRAILFDDDEDGKRVFDIIECDRAEIPAMLRWRDRQDGLDWKATVNASWAWERGKARRYDVLAKRALDQSPPEP